MAVTLLELARIFATKVPGKIDADVLQLLWKVSFLSIFLIIDFVPVALSAFTCWSVNCSFFVIKLLIIGIT